jgi:hypothetical protein
MEPELCVTLDLDWAPDFAIDDAAAWLEQHGVRATWFVTHASPAVDRLRARPERFELGIHPNFLPGSTHGATPEAVLVHCLELVPGARAMRTHGLVQSTALLDTVLRCTDVRIDVSLFLPRLSHLRPFVYPWAGRELVRVPYGFEDDLEMARAAPDFGLGSLLALGPGLVVLSFHPIHLALNSASMAPYRRVRALATPLTSLRRDQAEPEVNPGPGARSLFLAVLAHLGARGGGRRIRDVAADVALDAGGSHAAR